MKVIIDLVEDLKSSIDNDKEFSLRAINLYESDTKEFVPSWQTDIASVKIDDETKKMFVFLGVEPMGVEEMLVKLDSLSNEQMMYEILLSYYKDEKRADTPLIGFGESFKDKKYLFFISE